MQGFTTIDLIILVVYLAAVLFAGLYFSKKEMKGKEFFKGDGTIPLKNSFPFISFLEK